MNIQKQLSLYQFDPLNLDFVKKIGQGVCSTVWKITEKQSKKSYSLKIIKNKIISKKLSDFTEKLSTIQLISHDSLIKHFYFYSDAENLYQINELIENPTLFQVIFDKKSLSESESYSYIAQIIDGLDYLHHRTPPVYHGDITLKNIFLSNTGKIKLSCFGCANFLSDRKTSPGKDIWNLGTVLYEMLCGCMDFSQYDKEAFFKAFDSEKINKDLSSQCRDFLKILVNESENLTIDLIRKHDWIASRGMCSESLSEEEVSLEYSDSNFSTNSTEFIQTRDSCLESKDDLESEIEKLQILEFKIANVISEKKQLLYNEEDLKGKLDEAGKELEQLNLIDTSQELLASLDKAQKNYFLKSETCKKQKIYLEKLKKVLEDKEKLYEEKEKQLRSLIDSNKSLNIGMFKIKSHRSFDLSSLRLNLDVLQFKIEEKSFQTNDSGWSLQDLKELIQVRVDSIKFVSKSDYRERASQIFTKSSDLQQKIADLALYYELEKGKIIKKFHFAKEKINLSLKKKKEELARNRSLSLDAQKKKLSDQVRSAPKLDIYLKNSIYIAKSKLSSLKSALSIKYLQVKSRLKEKFYLERQIDSRQLEIDDLRFEIYNQKKV